MGSASIARAQVPAVAKHVSAGSLLGPLDELAGWREGIQQMPHLHGLGFKVRP